MEWIERLNSAINYIEEHLTDEIDFDEISKITLCSSYHFQRMFAYMADVPLSEYIRRRKMSRAAADLQDASNKVIDVSLKYGYDSPTAFNRAFQRIHGIAPSEARGGLHSLKAYPPISFKISIKGDCVMDYRIEKKEAFRIVGLSIPLEKEIEKNFEVVPAMWGQAAQNGMIEKLANMMDGEVKGLLGVSSCNEESDWKYYIAVASNQEAETGLEEFMVPEATWAIFRGNGTNISIQELEKQIVTDWLPTSGYEYGNAPDVEVYINPNPENAIYEVWIPVVKKN
ncbi:AraC family transcriptional regulator [Lacrimispora xylanisolvens]|uniref:AraC family transcriptional regulator n=1 Tax=Lacrimispora xylanisolvens TaxID=384636 RepID=A0A2S6HVG8_9FIRM|nr:AraC family transcriptional regulator [Hungatella xylanolytica]PPK81946.1 AraC family transcriptional regulator [Hungatella xylanolytica]